MGRVYLALVFYCALAACHTVFADTLIIDAYSDSTYASGAGFQGGLSTTDYVGATRDFLGLNTLINFRRPNIPVGQKVSSASFSMRRAGTSTSEFNADLYGIPKGTLGSLYYHGGFGLDAKAFAIQDDFATLATGSLATTNGQGSQNLATFINQELAANPSAQSFTIRLSPDFFQIPFVPVDPNFPNSAYKAHFFSGVTSAQIAGVAPPRIVLTTVPVPEPEAEPLLLLGGLLLTAFGCASSRRKRVRTTVRAHTVPHSCAG